MKNIDRMICAAFIIGAFLAAGSIIKLFSSNSAITASMDWFVPPAAKLLCGYVKASIRGYMIGHHVSADTTSAIMR